MYRLIESIRLLDGTFSRLEFHQARLENSFREVFKKRPEWQLESLLSEQPVPQSGLFKCRVVYDAGYRNVEFKRYERRRIQTLKLVDGNNIQYSHKWEDREQLEQAYAQRGTCDDILIVKNGLITDSCNANVVFQRDDTWYTPQSCLLPGSMRQFLLQMGVIQESVITESNFKKFDQFKLINAMLEWENPAVDVSNIY